MKSHDQQLPFIFGKIKQAEGHQLLSDHLPLTADRKISWLLRESSIRGMLTIDYLAVSDKGPIKNSRRLAFIPSEREGAKGSWQEVGGGKVGDVQPKIVVINKEDIAAAEPIQQLLDLIPRLTTRVRVVLPESYLNNESKKPLSSASDSGPSVSQSPRNGVSSSSDNGSTSPREVGSVTPVVTSPMSSPLNSPRQNNTFFPLDRVSSIQNAISPDMKNQIVTVEIPSLKLENMLVPAKVQSANKEQLATQSDIYAVYQFDKDEQQPSLGSDDLRAGASKAKNP